MSDSRSNAAVLPSSGVTGRFGLARPVPVAARHDQHVWETTTDRTASMLRDMWAAVLRWPLWIRLGWQDVLLRYRRSLLGPFWLTLSMGVMIGTLGNIYGKILHLPTVQYLPFLATGVIVWSLINALVSEGCQTFIESDWLIRQIDLPLSMFPMKVVWRNWIVFLHTAVIYLFMLLVLPIPIRWNALTVIPALGLILFNGLWVGTLLGMLSARFRDMPQIVVSLMQVVFFATPIIWSTEALSGDAILWTANPFYHLIEIVRAPLLGFRVPIHSWIAVLAITVVGWGVTLVMFRQFHRRISYWV